MQPMDDPGNFLGDFLASIEMIPNDMRRNFELIRELDRQSSELSAELDSLEKAFLRTLRERGERDEAGLEYIGEVRGVRMHTVCISH